MLGQPFWTLFRGLWAFCGLHSLCSQNLLCDVWEVPGADSRCWVQGVCLSVLIGHFIVWGVLSVILLSACGISFSVN